MLTILLAAFTVTLASYLFSLLAFTSPAHDQSWLIYAAQQILAGAKLYGPRVVEVNPPLIIWFSAIPALLARLLHIDPLRALQIVVLAGIFVSTAWCARILRLAGLAAQPVLFYASIVSVLAAELFLHGFDFGQREQLLVALILPWLLWVAFCSPSSLPTAERCLLGFAAGVAVCFKPQQVLILFAVALFIVIRDRSLRRIFTLDFVCAGIAVVTYIATVWIAAPLYLSKTIPLLLDTYWAYGDHTTWALIKESPVYGFIYVAVLAIFLWRRHSLRYASATGLFLACSLAACIAYCMQHVNAPYHIYPQEAFLLLALFWLVMGYLTPAYMASWRFNSAFVLSVLVFALVFVPLIIVAGRRLAKTSSALKSYPESVFERYPPQTPVYIFSDNVWDAFPAVLEDHLVWANRTPFMWMLPAIIQNEVAEAGGPAPRKVLPTAVVKKLADLQRADTTEDFRRWKPAVVIDMECHPAHPCRALDHFDFDPLKWFLKSPAFAAEWSHYRLQSSHGVFDVYTRVP